MVKLLIIEDDEAAAGSLKRGLEDAGYAVELAHDGERGLRQAQAGDHDLWMIDIMLPGRDGLSVLKALPVWGFPWSRLSRSCFRVKFAWRKAVWVGRHLS